MSPCTSSNLPESGVGHTIRIPIWSCSGWGLPCHWCYHQRGALLPHHFTLTCEGGIFSVALAVGLRRPDVIWHPALRSPDFPPPAESTGVAPDTAVLNRPRPSSVGSDYPADSRPIVKWKITNKTSVISGGIRGTWQDRDHSCFSSSSASRYSSLRLPPRISVAMVTACFTLNEFPRSIFSKRSCACCVSSSG